MGNGSKTGMGSWCWAIPHKSQYKKEAMAFLEFLLKKEEILVMSKANGAVPATYSAIAESNLYGPEGMLNLFVQQLQVSAVPRPVTPAYPVITSAFQESFLDIKNGADVEATLDRAVKIIDEDIRDNEGYRFAD
jgi:multiple sugar transport system substrate-binding protein